MNSRKFASLPSAKRGTEYFIFICSVMLVLPTIAVLTAWVIWKLQLYPKIFWVSNYKINVQIKMISLNLSWKLYIHICLNFVKYYHQTTIIQNIQTFCYRLLAWLQSKSDSYLGCKKNDVHQCRLHWIFNFSCQFLHFNSCAPEHIKAQNNVMVIDHLQHEHA